MSSKNQIVVPREARENLKLRPGQRLYLKKVGRNEFTLSTQTAIDKYYGALRGIFTEDAVEYQRAVRQDRGQPGVQI